MQGGQENHYKWFIFQQESVDYLWKDTDHFCDYTRNEVEKNNYDFEFL